MSKYRIFKCKKTECRCVQAWVVECGGFVQYFSRSHAVALDWALGKVARDAS